MTFPRVRAMIFVAVLFVTAGVVVLTAINKDTQATPQAVNSCEPGQVRVNVEVVAEEEVTVNLYNGTVRVGLAEQIGSELSNRGFHVAKMETVPAGQEFGGIGKITFGPDGVGAAWLVKAYFLNNALEEIFVAERTGSDVDLVLGAEFQQLATSTEVNQRIAALGKPKPPRGTCAA
jgi:hypothetical protein